MSIDVTVRAVLQSKRDQAADQLLTDKAALVIAQDALLAQAAAVEALRALVASLDAALVEEE